MWNRSTVMKPIRNPKTEKPEISIIIADQLRITMNTSIDMSARLSCGVTWLVRRFCWHQRNCHGHNHVHIPYHWYHSFYISIFDVSYWDPITLFNSFSIICSSIPIAPSSRCQPITYKMTVKKETPCKIFFCSTVLCIVRQSWIKNAQSQRIAQVSSSP